MKRLSIICFATGSLAAIALFTYRERLNISSFFAAYTKVKATGMNNKKVLLVPSTTRAPKAIALLPNEKNIDSSQYGATLLNDVKESPLLLSGDNTTDKKVSGAPPVAAEFLPRTAIFSYTQVAFKKTIDISELAKKMNKATDSILLERVAPLNDSTTLRTEITAADPPEDITLENGQFAGQEVSSLPQEMETEPSITEPQTTAVSLNGTEMAASAGASVYSSKSTTTPGINPEKNSQNTSAMDILAFTSVNQPDNGTDTYSYTFLYEAADQLKEYAERNGYNTEYALIANLGIKSGKKRFFVIDLSGNTIVKSGIVAQGRADSPYGNEKKYSNEMGSSASSLGIYKIDKLNKDSFSLAYRLYGLQESNSQAYTRSMMLQATDDVPYEEIGCAVLKTNGSLSLSTRFLKEISPMLDESVKPVLLWVYDPSADNQSLYSATQKTH